MKRDTLLVVDDIEVNRLLLEEIFRNQYKVIHAANGEEALEMLKEHYQRLAAIMLDLQMPVMDGYQFLEHSSHMPEAECVPVIVVTVDDTNASQLRVLDFGVADVIRKPYNPKVVSKRVKNVVSLYEYREILEHVVEKQTYALKEKETELHSLNERLVEALSSVVEFRDVETGEHVQRIKKYTQILCEVMLANYPDCGLTRDKIELIVSAAALHDVGKIAIPDAILLKPGKLTPEEFDVIKTHTTKGGELLDRIDINSNPEYMDYCKNIALYHHEKYDGRGYPRGLKEEEIPLEAQIVSVADVFDALVSKRIYKDAYSTRESYEMILRGECGKFSERVMDCFRKSFFRFEETALNSYAPPVEA